MATNPRKAAAEKASAAAKKQEASRAAEAAKTVADYAKNVASAYKKWDNLKNAPAHNPEAGQFWGALLQNRKYDKKGRIR